MFEHDDLVGIADGREAVGDHEGRAALHQGLECLLDARLGDRVEGAGCLVEDQDRRVLEQRPGNREPLAFAPRERRAALADQRLVPLRLAHDEVVRLGQPGGLLQLGLRGIGLADAQIVGDRAVEHGAVLEHHADVPSQRFQLDVAMVDPVDADHARLGVPHAVQQRQRGALAGAGRADEGHRRPGRHLQREMHQRGPLAVVGEVDVVELDVAAGATEVDAVRLVRNGRLRIQHAEEVAQRRHLEEDAADEARGLVHAPDQHGGEAHEAHDLADRRLAAGIEPRAQHEDQDDGDRRGGAGQDRQERPPVQHRELRLQGPADDAVHLAGFRGQPHEALDEVDVAQRVAGPARQLAVQVLDLLLQPVGAVHDPDVGDGEDQDQDQQQEPQPPVHEHAERQHDEQRHKGRQVLAEERQPDAEQVVDAGQHDLDQPAGVLGVVEGEGQHQQMLEVGRHRAQPPAMGHAVGLQRHHHVGHDAAQSDQRPEAENLTRVVPQLLDRPAACVAQQVDHLAKQYGLVELQPGHRDVGDGQRDGEALLGPQQADDAAIDAEEFHGVSSASVRLRRPWGRGNARRCERRSSRQTGWPCR